MLFSTVEELELQGVSYNGNSQINFKNKRFSRTLDFAKDSRQLAIKFCQSYLNAGIVCLIVESHNYLTVWIEEQEKKSNIDEQVSHSDLTNELEKKAVHNQNNFRDFLFPPGTKPQKTVEANPNAQIKHNYQISNTIPVQESLNPDSNSISSQNVLSNIPPPNESFHHVPPPNPNPENTTKLNDSSSTESPQETQSHPKKKARKYRGISY
jgi:hypothetical protein